VGQFDTYYLCVSITAL